MGRRVGAGAGKSVFVGDGDRLRRALDDTGDRLRFTPKRSFVRDVLGLSVPFGCTLFLSNVGLIMSLTVRLRLRCVSECLDVLSDSFDPKVVGCAVKLRDRFITVSLS